MVTDHRGFVGRVDFWWEEPGVVGEFDGRSKYGLDGSVPAAADRLWDEKLRQDFVTGFKTGVSRLTWNDFFGQQRARALDRCRREFLDTCARFGTDISDLAHTARAGRSPRSSYEVVRCCPCGFRSGAFGRGVTRRSRNYPPLVRGDTP